MRGEDVKVMRMEIVDFVSMHRFGLAGKTGHSKIKSFADSSTPIRKARMTASMQIDVKSWASLLFRHRL